MYISRAAAKTKQSKTIIICSNNDNIHATIGRLMDERFQENLALEIDRDTEYEVRMEFNNKVYILLQRNAEALGGGGSLLLRFRPTVKCAYIPINTPRCARPHAARVPVGRVADPPSRRRKRQQ